MPTLLSHRSRFAGDRSETPSRLRSRRTKEQSGRELPLLEPPPRDWGFLGARGFEPTEREDGSYH